ncbi:putative radical SAM superfamily Fe-S cluster-containing enzyme [Actinomadura coerulea]|uniref:Putative radical SAM superfamily Fe-S cluster-containing enzyme n=1 Tax=Actinomadura coerulea TaxID=46159 RepID=A0A7X0KYS0_9ACTN|nr:putative radical SAM superfamily Fe-S cluster-containing enzyme [Actinomadura coerulea]GGQ43431.1 hypothetical protein GCM10010187_72440 [Actinomadura coerulea]
MPAVQLSSQATEAPPARATVADTLRIGAAVFVPTLARGVLAHRPGVVALAEAVQADRRVRGVQGLPVLLRQALPGPPTTERAVSADHSPGRHSGRGWMVRSQRRQPSMPL